MSECKACQGLDVVTDYLPTKLYETERIKVYLLNTGALSRGHCLFLPKTHYEKMTEVDTETLTELIVNVQKVAKAMKLINFNVLNNNGGLAFQTLFHVHFHLIPKTSEEDGLRYLRDWDQYGEVDIAGLKEEILAGILN